MAMAQARAQDGIEAFRTIYRNDALGEDDLLGQLGVDSLVVVQWVALLEKKTGAEIGIGEVDFTRLSEMTVGELSRLVLGSGR